MSEWREQAIQTCIEADTPQEQHSMFAYLVLRAPDVATWLRWRDDLEPLTAEQARHIADHWNG